MVGIPIFSGFVSKLLFAGAALEGGRKMLPALIVLAVSTILNAIYFMKTVIRLYTPLPLDENNQAEIAGERIQYSYITAAKERGYAITICLFVLVNILLGMSSQPVVKWIETGLAVFK